MRKKEKKSLLKLKEEVDRAIASALENQSAGSKLGKENINTLRELSSSALSAEPIGRVIGNYNSIDVLKNTKLVSGDKIIIPKRPTSISIVGEVLSRVLYYGNKNLQLKNI